MLHKIYWEFFCIPKYKKITNKRFHVQMGLLVLSMIVCCTAFCATTFAWFTAQQGAKVEPIVAAEYSVQVLIDGSAINTESSPFSLVKEDKHTVTITANGTATSGYVVIKVGENSYRTQQIPKGQSITITITAAQGEKITFDACWGEEYWRQGCLRDGDTLEISHTPYVTYTVAEGVALAQISEHYDVSEADILLYNGISELTIGQEIKIPNSTVTESLIVQYKKTIEKTVENAKESKKFTEETTKPTEETTNPETTDSEFDSTSAEQENKQTCPAATDLIIQSAESDEGTEY